MWHCMNLQCFFKLPNVNLIFSFFLEGRIPSAWVAKPCHSTTGQRMTDSKKDLSIPLMSSLVRWAVNKLMKAVVKKMGQLQILCVCTGLWGTKGKVLHTLSLVEHSYHQGMNIQLGNSITALGRVFLPHLLFCFPLRRKMSEIIIMLFTMHLWWQCNLKWPNLNKSN